MQGLVWHFLYYSVRKLEKADGGADSSTGRDPRLPQRRASRDDVWEKIGWILFVLMIALLAFVGGAMVILSETFPHDFLRDAYRAGEALVERHRISQDPLRTNLWRRPRTDARGVTTHDPSRTWPGYTLFTSGDEAVARLVDMNGRIVHEWRRPFSTVWNDQAAVSRPQADRLIYMDDARLFPNGDLLAIYISSADTPWGYGMVKLDWNSDVIWSYLEPTHHDFDVTPDGRIVVLTHGFTFEPFRRAPQLDRPHLEDFVAILTPNGEEIEKISLTGALVRSPYAELLRILPFFSLADPLHTNTVEYIDAEKARNFPFGEEGDLLVSFRDIALIAVVSGSTGEIVWATRGPWVGQHDPSILPDGHILLFDNFGAFSVGNSSRVIEFDPRTLNIQWSYSGDDERPFHSGLRSGAQRLPNGNTLITESDGGRLLEVAWSGDIVWEYVNPIRRANPEPLIPVVSAGQRIDPRTLDPELRSRFARSGKRP